jgi:hypothetical protein
MSTVCWMNKIMPITEDRDFEFHRMIWGGIENEKLNLIN